MTFDEWWKEVTDGKEFPDYKLCARQAWNSALESREGWVSVSDRMPKPPKGERKWYLVTDGKRIDIAMLIHGKTFMGHALQFDQITHWQEPMSLPTPPSTPSPEETKR